MDEPFTNLNNHQCRGLPNGSIQPFTDFVTIVEPITNFVTIVEPITNFVDW